ncbi:hypothetical protein D3C72_2140350 [compost metagenome]
MSLALVAAMKRFTGSPSALAMRPAVRLPKLPDGTLMTALARSALGSWATASK